VKRVLMVAFQFPPMAGTSGIERTLRFANHLPNFGWEPVVLSAHPRAYERTSDDKVTDANGTVVERAFALDSARHLALLGRYPAFVARPDRWVSWYIGAVPKGLAMIKRYKPDVLWSTYPIATAHKIAETLAGLSGLPWVADFRDPMAQDGYPSDKKTWRSYKRIEAAAIAKAARSVFVTGGAAQVYRERYGVANSDRIAVIENGYDEETIGEVSVRMDGRREPLVPGRITLLHSGVVYPSERDPTHLFIALRRMLDENSLSASELCIRLRACGHENVLRPLIEKYRVGPVVELAPPLPYRAALEEMMRADGLLILQASNCNQQVPAKVYEYLRCRRPVIGLTDPAGDTAALMRSAGLADIAPLDSPENIAATLRRFIDRIKTGPAIFPDENFVRNASRFSRTRELAALFERLQ
jgi:hypothetical protein